MKDKYLIFGTGSGCDAFLINADEEDFDSILGFVDNNKEKQGTLYRGKKVFSVDEIKDFDYNKIIVASLYYNEIKDNLVKKGIAEEKIVSLIRDFTCSNFKQLVFLDKEKHKLKNKNFSIISPYCWGLFLYRLLGVEYNNPFVGAFLIKSEFLRLIEKPEYYLNQKIKIEELDRAILGHFCRAYLDDIYFDFYHDHDSLKLEKKWYRRLERVDMDNLFVHLGYSEHSQMDSLFENEIKNHDNSLVITKEGACLQQKDKKIITTKEPLDLIKWFNKEL